MNSLRYHVAQSVLYNRQPTSRSITDALKLYEDPKFGTITSNDEEEEEEDEEEEEEDEEEEEEDQDSEMEDTEEDDVDE